ncbi:F-box protein pof7 [Colletotrichum chlorophyti]|uniref:F-box protein pof7 n=1 Tax=Colletotrichum chlorophyti TaxID=708187 RepID=A0A1Q8RJ32_9PEZI|nr:F-box protein pof7 [Colletotrichum chlorophyti]
MADKPPQLDSELESFRQQWQTELKSKKPAPDFSKAPQLQKSVASSSKASVPKTGSKSAENKKSQVDEDEEYARLLSFDEAPAPSGRTVDQPDPQPEKELVSALDHFEEAVEKEAIGNLGDSLKLYRKAFRLDSRVDLAYRKKHFPAAAKAPQASASTSQIAIPSTSAKPSAKAPQQSISELIASFSGLSVSAAPPPVEGDPAPPCPIAELPEEILVHIFSDLAVLDVGDFARLSQVCKRFAYIIATEQQPWRRVCLGPNFGFAGMHYHWQKGVSWEPLEQGDDTGDDAEFVSMQELAQRRQEESLTTTLALLPQLYSSSWQKMFRHRPRIRFNGCYISTVNYIRSGQASTNQTTWGSPVHIVTYYRYLRFFRDGTAISLLTTTEPGDVVHYMTKDHLEQHRGGAAAHLPSVVMQNGLRGRWRLSSALDHPDAPLGESEGDVFIETDGVGPKYMYRMEMSLRNAGKGARNTKLVWKGFYSYNKLTDDWGEFGLKNDKPFYFSRVKSYGVGN